MNEFYKMTAYELFDLVKSKKASAKEIAKSYIDRVNRVENDVKSYVTTTFDLMLKQAEAIDEKVAKGEELPILAGVPGAIKDNMSTRGINTTASSKILENYVPVYDACVVEKLRNAGVTTVGKTNMDEFAMGSSTENSAFFKTRNPWDISKVPGGSSGGSAASVAADECAFSLGSDTGGSIRQPASFCGVVGFKPTYGRVSRYGLLAFASSLDQIGPITKDVTDSALVLNAICGKDCMDSTSLDIQTPDFTKALRNDVKGLKIGVPKEFFGEGMDPEIVEYVQKAIQLLKDLGADFKEISLPNVGYGIPVYYIIAPAECSSNLARYDGVSYGHRSKKASNTFDLYNLSREEGFGDEVKQRIMIGTYALSAGYYDAYYLKAQKVRTLIKNDFEKAFEEFDVILSPTSPTTAFGIGDKTSDPYAMKLADVCTIPANLAGIPAMSIPCGFAKGMPIGLQIMAKALDEETMLRVAYTFEQNTDYHKRKPVI